MRIKKLNSHPAPNTRALSQVEQAVLELPKKKCRAVLVPGGFFLTAAHCIDWSAEGGMALGDDYVEECQTANGERLLLSVLAVEPCADIAVLGAIDNQRAPDLAEQVEAFMERTVPVPLFTGELTPFSDVLTVHIFNNDKSWVQGTARTYREGQRNIPFETAVEIKGGASGGPIVTAAGELVALVSFSEQTSHGTKTKKRLVGSGPRPRHALPVWVTDAIMSAMQHS